MPHRRQGTGELVDHDREMAGALDDVALEGRFGDVDWHSARLAGHCAGLRPETEDARPRVAQPA